MFEMDLQQARYEESLAERRSAACDPENRLFGGPDREELGSPAERGVRRVRLSMRFRLRGPRGRPETAGYRHVRCRQQLLLALIKDIVAESMTLRAR